MNNQKMGLCDLFSILRTHAITVIILTRKSLMMTWRQRSNVNLFIFSFLAMFVSMYSMWYLMRYNVLHYLSSLGYEKLHFDYICNSKGSEIDSQITNPMKYRGKLPCDLTPIPDQYGNGISPGELLMRWFDPAQDSSFSRAKENQNIIELLSSLMMNGLPLVGLDDFVYLSDFANEHLQNSRIKQDVFDTPQFKDEFDNFLNVRSKRLIFVPNSPCTTELVEYLHKKSKVFGQLRVSVLENMPAALENCCEDVWAVIEVKPPVPFFENDLNSLEESTCRMSPIVLQDLTNSTESDLWENLGIEPFVDLNDFVYVSKPTVTIRMHPGSIADTRNIVAWSRLKRSLPRPQSGQLLYFTSGFLSLQMELQDFMVAKQYQINSKWSQVTGLKEALVNHTQILSDLSYILITSQSIAKFDGAFLNYTLSYPPQQSRGISFPLYHRAFPTHTYTKVSPFILYTFLCERYHQIGQFLFAHEYIVRHCFGPSLGWSCLLH